jgi:hypothetical protein
MEVVLAFGRGRQKWLISSNGEYVGGGGGGEAYGAQAGCPAVITFEEGVREGGGRLALR